MTEKNKTAREVEERLRKLKASLGVENKKARADKIQKKSEESEFWSDKEKASVLMKELGELKDQIEKVELTEKALSDAKTAAELGMDKELKDQIEKAEELLNTLEFEAYLSGPYDSKDAILSIHAGQGGTEAMDWVSMLYRMYLRYCEGKDWTTETIESSEGEEAGLKSVTVSIGGHFVYGYLKGEAGTHRLVRQSPFNADKLRQTSFALVEVLPSLEEVDIPDLKIGDEELEWQFFRASTQGGQNVQKVSTAVRLTHKPSGIVVTAQTERHQQQNRQIALNLLRAKLWARVQAMREKQVKELKGDYRPPSWGNQIRSYVLHPYKMVKDLRTNIETGDADAVLDGDLDEFISAQLKLN